MAVLHPMHSSMKFNACKFCLAAGKRESLTISCISSRTINQRNKILTTNIPNNLTFQEFSQQPNKRIISLVNDHEYRSKVKSGFVVQRLEKAVERIIDLEIGKLKGKFKPEMLSDDDEYVLMADSMSREIVSKFLEKPIRYLTSDNGFKLEQKLKDLNFLVSVLERYSCPT